jgi:4-amino-4-deoxy-L-arabinose transferase-like glycosyltransferase
MRAVPFRRVEWSMLAALWLLALLSRLTMLAAYPFDGLYGQDSFAYFDFARQLQQLQPGAFFWPWGYPAVLAVGFALLGAQAEAGQLISLLMGAALAPLTYILARQIGGGRIGALVAGVLMAICGQAMQSSLVLMADVPALFWALLSAIILWHGIKTDSSKWMVLAAALLAFAGITRWLYLILVLPFAAAVQPFRWRTLMMAALVGISMVGGQLLLGRISQSPGLHHDDLTSWSATNAWQKGFDNPDGHFEYPTNNAAFYAQPFYSAYYLAPVFTPFVIIGALALVIQRRAARAMLIGWALLPYLFLIGIPFQNIRFPLIVFPAVAALAGVGLEMVYAAAQHTRLRRLAPPLILVILLGGSALTLDASRKMIVPFIQAQQKDRAVVQWASRQIPPEATVYTFGITQTLKHYTDLNVRELYGETPESLAAQWLPDKADYLLLNVWSVENQWAGLSPQIAYHWLRNNRGLVRLGSQNNYLLFYVNGRFGG